MKKLFTTLTLCTIILLSSGLMAQIKVGTTPGNIDPSAMLEVQSTTKGFLPPRMTGAERDAIVQPAKGLIVYNTTADCLQTNIGTPAAPSWKCINEGTTAPAVNPLSSMCGGGTTGGSYPVVTDFATCGGFSMGVAGGDLFVMGGGILAQNLQNYPNAPKAFVQGTITNSPIAYVQPTFFYGSDFDGLWPNGTVTDVEVMSFGSTDYDAVGFVADGRAFFRYGSAYKFFEFILPTGKVAKQLVIASGTGWDYSILTTDGDVYHKPFAINGVNTANITLTSADLVAAPGGVVTKIKGGYGGTNIWTSSGVYFYGHAADGYDTHGIGCGVATTVSVSKAAPLPLKSAYQTVVDISSPLGHGNCNFFALANGDLYHQGELNTGNALPLPTYNTNGNCAPMNLRTSNLQYNDLPANEKVIMVERAAYGSASMLTDAGNVYTYINCGQYPDVLSHGIYKESLSGITKIFSSNSTFPTSYYALTNAGTLIVYDATFGKSDQTEATTVSSTRLCSGNLTWSGWSNGIKISASGNQYASYGSAVGFSSPTLIPICK